MIQQRRIAAQTVDDAVMLIRDKHGFGELRIWRALVQPFPGETWFEFSIEVENDEPIQ